MATLLCKAISWSKPEFLVSKLTLNPVEMLIDLRIVFKGFLSNSIR